MARSDLIPEPPPGAPAPAGPATTPAGPGTTPVPPPTGGGVVLPPVPPPGVAPLNPTNPNPPIGGPMRNESWTRALPWGGAARDYFWRNPDVAEAFRADSRGLSADDFARQHFEKFGRGENRYFRGLSQPIRTDANPFNTTKGSSRNALSYLAGERETAATAPAPAPTTPSTFARDIGKLTDRTKEEVKPDSFSQSYIDRYPDIWLAFQDDPQKMDINTFVRRHYEKFGKDEGRIWGDAQSLKNTSSIGSNDGSGGAAGGAVHMAGGGIAQLASGGQGRLLRGPGDGVSDSIPATINGSQPAKLADGEFVVPARIVSELGNGSTEAGARQLYAMLDRIQQRRAKTTGKGQVAVNSKAAGVLPA